MENVMVEMVLRTIYFGIAILYLLLALVHCFAVTHPNNHNQPEQAEPPAHAEAKIDAL
jgi:hypothetical protein